MSADLFTATGLDGRASYTPQRTELLWAQVPDALRLERYAPDTVPIEHQSAFVSAGRCSPLDLTGLPVGLRREFAWSVAGIVARGGLVPVGPLGMLVRHLPALLEDLSGRGIDVRSLMHFSPSGWEREFQRLALKHGRAELAVKSARGTLRRIYRPLWIGVQWWFKISLELERLTWSTLRGFLTRWRSCRGSWRPAVSPSHGCASARPRCGC